MKLNIQLFAEETINTTGSSEVGNNLSAENKTFYDKQLIRLAGSKLVFSKFGQKRDIPQNGGKTIEFRQFSPLAKAMTPLTEGVTPDGQALNVTAKSATVRQYGGYVTVTDMLDLTAIDKVVLETVEIIGNQAGKTLDSVVRNVLMAGTNVQYGDGTVSERSALTGGNEEGNNYLTVDALEKAVTTLKKQNAEPMDDGFYVAIIHPSVAYDLMRDPKWAEYNKYTAGNAEKLMKGEIGCIAGCRVIETTEAKIWKGASDGGKNGRAVYASLVIGKNAYGVTELTGGGLRTIIKQLGSAGTSDPLDQRSTVGWKAAQTAEILVDQYMVRIETCSSYNDEAN